MAANKPLNVVSFIIHEPIWSLENFLSSSNNSFINVSKLSFVKKEADDSSTTLSFMRKAFTVCILTGFRSIRL